jgi:hypothetical protein
LAEISKLSGVAIANVAKVDAVTKANIADINGLTIPSAFTPLLDQSYASGAAAAYSVRQLKSTATVSMRVVRSTSGTTGDGDEADVGFDTSFTNPEISLDSAISNASAGVTATTLGEFLNVGTVGGTTYSNPDSLTVTAEGLVTSFKDQSGNNNHATQTGAGRRPYIHDGTVNTDIIKDNGKPALKVNPLTQSVDFRLDMTTSITLDSAFVVARQSGFSSGFAVQLFYILGNSAGNTYQGLAYGGIFVGDDAIYYDDVGSFPSLQSTTAVGTTQRLVSLHADATTDSLAVDGTVEATGTVSAVTFSSLLNRTSTNAGNRFEGYAHEFILYDVDKLSDRTSIENEQNAYFSIY